MRLFLGLFLAFTAFGLRAEPLVILVSIDGCRWDYPELHHAPFLQELAATGTRVQRLVPSYPSKTFPNHYTLVTGLRPESHGIVQNRFYDPNFEAWFGIGNHPAAREGRWWGGEPIWLTAQRQGLRSACMFWPGSEADILGQHPQKFRRYDSDFDEAARVAQVLKWTALPANQRPNIITLYFEAVDNAGHKFGPTADETGEALRYIDANLSNLRAGLQEQGLWETTSLIVTADHGMTYCATDHSVAMDDLIDLTQVEVVFAGACGGLHVKTGDIDDLVAKLNSSDHLHAYRRETMPERLHFSHNDRIPDIVIVPDLGWRVETQAWMDRSAEKPSLGDHGFDPIEPDMSAIFIAHGPLFSNGVVFPPADNIHVYNLLCALLQIEPAPNEGDTRLLSTISTAPLANQPAT